MMPRSVRQDIDAEDAERTGGFFFRGAVEGDEAVHLPGLFETEIGEQLHELCRPQSAGNSAGPEVDILARVFAQLPSDDDVAEVEPTARF